MTGPTPETRQACWVRDDGMCVACGIRLDVFSELHHRRPRGAGGTKRPETNLPSNLIWLCRECHVWVESHRKEARTFGYLVAQHETPASVAVAHHCWLVFLTDDATLEEA